MPRYALYFAPPAGSPLDRFGTAWLGRDARSGAAVAPPAVPGLSPDAVAAATVAPRRYGFHATLKPPFTLAPGESLAALEAALADFAAGHPAVPAPPLRLAAIGSFLALVPAGPAPGIQALADACVARFDRFRAPPGAAEVARRRGAGLSPREALHLERWGYPYVFDTFRFHMTLSDALPTPLRDEVAAALVPLVAPFAETPLAIDAVSLFVEPEPGAPFRMAGRYALAGRG